MLAKTEAVQAARANFTPMESFPGFLMRLSGANTKWIFQDAGPGEQPKCIGKLAFQVHKVTGIAVSVQLQCRCTQANHGSRCSKWVNLNRLPSEDTAIRWITRRLLFRSAAEHIADFDNLLASHGGSSSSAGKTISSHVLHSLHDAKLGNLRIAHQCEASLTICLTAWHSCVQVVGRIRHVAQHHHIFGGVRDMAVSKGD